MISNISASHAHQKQIEFLKLLLRATRSGRTIWQRGDTASHHAELAGVRFLVRFKYPLIAGNDGSDADAVEITAGRAVWTVYSGTEDFGLVGEILAAAYPELGEHNREITAQLEDTIATIRKSAGARGGKQVKQIR